MYLRGSDVKDQGSTGGKGQEGVTSKGGRGGEEAVREEEVNCGKLGS